MPGKDESGDPPILKLKTERVVVAGSKALKQEEELDFALWNLGIGPGELAQVKQQALSRGLSVQVYVREHLGINVPGVPVVKIRPAAVSPSQQCILDNELSRRAAYTIQRSKSAVRYFDHVITFQDCETYTDLEKQINRLSEEVESKHAGESVCLAYFRRIPNRRFQVMFRVSPQPRNCRWRYAVRVFKVRRLDDVPLALTLFNGDIHSSAELVSYAYLSRVAGFRLVAIFRCPVPMDSLR